MNQILKRLLSKKADFISGRELQAAVALQTRCDEFSAHVARYEKEALSAAVDEAKRAYVAEPSLDCLIGVEKALETQKARHVLSVSLGTLIEDARARFLSCEVADWAKPIWQRGFALAQENLANTTKAEAERILTETGSPMTHSDLVVAATAAVTSLEEIGRAFLFIERGDERAGLAMNERTVMRGDLRTPAQWLALFGYGLKGKLSA